MKRIINGRRFDTDTATEVASASGGGYNFSDFRYYEETLYRTPRGNWFLHGRGGASTRWSVAAPDGSRGGGENIHALSDAEALQWLEDAEETEAIEQWFADQVQDA